MGNVLSTFDLVIFFGSLIGVMAVGLWVGRKEDTSEDFYLAGKTTRWWGVAGSIFGSNVSANHLVGMMGVGFMVGFANSHFEITAICGLLMLCYVFLPVYRKLNVYTLSEYLGRRYNDASRVLYALIMIIIMVVIQMVPGFYIGSRSVNILLQGDKGQPAAAMVVVDEQGAIAEVQIVNSGRMYGDGPTVKISNSNKLNGGSGAKVEVLMADQPLLAVRLKQGGSGYDKAKPPTVTFTGAESTTQAQAIAVVNDKGNVSAVYFKQAGAGYTTLPKVEIAAPIAKAGKQATAFASLSDRGVSFVKVTNGGKGYSNKPKAKPGIGFTGGAKDDKALKPGDVDHTWYIVGIIIMALVTGTYTIFGGLKAVIFTDVIQSILMLIAGIVVAVIVFNQVGGWGELVARDKDTLGRLTLYNPSTHSSLPWTGVLTGLMVLHFFYWGSNQFIVQRALAAKSDNEARTGIIAAGFFKLLIPFFSIGTGIAAWYYYSDQGKVVSQDAVFTTLLADLVAPIGYGIVGLVAAGLIGAILSSLDSMMNSAATIFTFDIYKRYFKKDASEAHLIRVGRVSIVAFILIASIYTIASADPNADTSFFLKVASNMGKFVTGIVVAMFMGMLWKRSHWIAGFVSIVSGMVLSYTVAPIYGWFVQLFRTEVNGKVVYEGVGKLLVDNFGVSLNFFHAVFVAAVLCVILHVIISLLLKPDEEKGKLTWIGLGIFTPETMRRTWIALGVSLVVFAILGCLIVPWGDAKSGTVAPVVSAWLAAIWTAILFWIAAYRHAKAVAGSNSATFGTVIKNDRFWAGLLAACAIFMMYYFY